MKIRKQNGNTVSAKAYVKKGLGRDGKRSILVLETEETTFTVERLNRDHVDRYHAHANGKVYRAFSGAPVGMFLTRKLDNEMLTYAIDMEVRLALATAFSAEGYMWIDGEAYTYTPYVELNQAIHEFVTGEVRIINKLDEPKADASDVMKLADNAFENFFGPSINLANEILNGRK